MIVSIFNFLTTDSLSLWGPFLLLQLCSIGFPMPEDIVLVTAGVLGAQNNIHVLKSMGLMYLGILIGDGIVFLAGKKLGYHLLETRIAKALIQPERFGKVQAMFLKWGKWVIFVGRFLPGLRTPIFFTAGTLRFSSLKFFAMDGFAALISAPLFVWFGHWAWKTFGDDFGKVEKTLGVTKIVFFIVVILALGGGLLNFLKQKKKTRSPI